MAIRTKDELMQSLKEYSGEDTGDIFISILEDLSDTLDDYNSKLGEDWKSKYEENDQAWRNKYRERFFNTPGKEGDKLSGEPDAEESEEPLTYEHLFEVKEE